MDLPSSGLFRFAAFTLDVRRRELRRDGERLDLPPRVFDTLVCLAAHPGDLLDKEAILQAVWPGRVVEENNLSQTISALRKLFGEEGAEARWILTVPGRGYRFLAPVEALDESPEVARPIPGPQPEGRERARRRWPVPRVVAVAAAALVLAAIGFWSLSLRRPPSRSTPRLAILPFKPLVPGARDPSLELGVTETLIVRLAAAGVEVSPLSAVRRYGGIEQDARQAGAELGVESVLDGSLQRWGDRIRVTARLVDVAGGQSRWAISLDERFTDLFGVEDALARRVAESLFPQLTGAQIRGLVHSETENIDAYQSYLTGQYHLAAVTEQSLRKSIDMFEDAIRLDPRFARAHAGLAEAYRRLAIAAEIRPSDVFPRVAAEAGTALQLDPRLADPHVALGYIRFWYDWRWDEAAAEFRRAIELDPRSAIAHLGLGQLQGIRGRFEQSLPEMARARELEPLSQVINSLEAWFLGSAGHPDEARRRVRRALDIDPQFWVAHWVEGNLALERGEPAIALQQFATASATSRAPQIRAALAHAEARWGNRAAAEATLAEMQAQARSGYVPGTAMAKIYAGLGRVDDAFTALDRAFQERDGRLTFLRLDPEWKDLRGDPRFVALLRRLQLE
jgi:DNA-binding winged helix-turn-helix (wHTH) protein/TolB-like protein/Tfp pilus assembly protein PilF